MINLSGQSLGRYHLIEKLGEGGMAVVYKAFDTRLECEVAVKIIRVERLTQEMMASTLKRFEREAKAVAQLTHANIVKVTDYGEYEGVPYLVMEYLPGGTLKQYLGKPIPYQEAAHLLAPVARALQYAHSRNIVHRDVKPSNILITESGEPMLTDFGIAKILDLNDGQTLTGTGVGIGTPEYMAPEQWVGTITPAVDIYSLGVVFYELVTGHKPYTAETPAAVLLKQATEPLQRPSSYVPGLPEKVEQVIYKAMAKKVDDRYQTAEEFASSLKMIAGENSFTRTEVEISGSESETNCEINSEIDAATIVQDKPHNHEVTQEIKLKKPVESRQRIERMIGISLIPIGLIMIAYYFIPTDKYYWPLWLICIGILFFIPLLVWKENQSKLAGLIIPGASFILTGSILLYSTLNQYWQIWPFAFLLILSSLGLGLMIASKVGKWNRKVGVAGKWSAVAGVTFFSVLSLFFSYGRPSRFVGPVLFLVVGVFILVMGFVKNKPNKK